MLLIPQHNVTTIIKSDEIKVACLYGDELIISSRKKPLKKRRPPWLAIGNGMEAHKLKSYPYEMTLLDLNSNEAAMYRLIRQAYDSRTGLSVVDLSNHTPSQKTELSKGFKALEQRELVKRAKPKVYMINPQAIVNLDIYDELQTLWDSL